MSLRSTLVGGLAALTFGTTGVLAATTTAGQATEPTAERSTPYVTKAEFRRVHKGMAIKRVHRIFDVAGKQTAYFPAYPSIGIPAEQWREYRVKSRWGSVEVDYVKRNGTWKVARKYAYWG